MVDGYTVSDERTAEGAAQHIDTTASIPSDTNIDIIVNQTTDGGLSLSETVTLSNGANNIDLSNFDDASGTYYIRVEFTGLSPDLGLGDVTLYVETDAGAERKTITWSTNEDWTNSQTAEGVVYEDTPNTDHTDADTVKRGYKIANPQPGSPFIYWPMHENSSSTAYDFGTSGNDGTVDSAVTQGNPGLIDTTSYGFDSSSYVQVGSTIPDDWVEDFENQDLSAWSTYGSGGGQITSFASRGDYALEVPRGSSNGNYLRSWSPPTSGKIELWFALAYENIGDFATFADFPSTSDNGLSSGFAVFHSGDDNGKFVEIRTADGTTEVLSTANDSQYYQFKLFIDLDDGILESFDFDGSTTTLNESLFNSELGDYIGIRAGDEGSNYASYVDDIRYESL